MDYHSLTRKELQTLCKKNKIRANMTNLAMADALSSLPMVHGVEDSPLLTSRKRRATATKHLSDLVVDPTRHTRSPLTENLYPSDIISPKATRTCLEKATGSLSLETKEGYVVNHTHGTRLANRLKQKSQLKIAESAQKVGGRYDAISIEMLCGEEKDEAIRTKCQVTDDVLQNNEGNKGKVSNAEQDDVVSGNVSSNMVYAEYWKLAKAGDLGELTLHLYGDQDATIEETSATSIMDGVSRDKIARALNGCSSEVSFAPMVSAAKSWNVARTLVGCTSEISSAPMVSAKKSMKVARVLNESSLMGKETATIKHTNEDQNMESEDHPIDLNVPYLMVEKAEDLEASHVYDEKSKLMCEVELCDVKVTEDEEENEEDGSNVNDDISDAVEKFLFSPSITGPIANQSRVHVSSPTRTTTSENKVQRTTPLMSSTKKKAFTTPIISSTQKNMNITGALVECTSEVFSASMKSAEKSMNNALAHNKSSLIGEETENTKHPNEDQNMEPKDQPKEINEVVECKGAHDLEVKSIEKNELSNVKGTEVETKYVDESSLMAGKAENLEDSNVDYGKSKLTCEVGIYNVKVTEVEENNTEDGSNVNDETSDVVEKLSFSPSVTDPIAAQILVHDATPTRTTASENQVQETTPLISSTMKKLATTLKCSIKVLDDKKEINEGGKHSVSTSKVATEVLAEQKQNKGENTSHGKLRSTSIRQLKKTIKQRICSENKNTIIEANKEVRPEKHENKGENTLQMKLKATSLRQLKKTIKQLTDSKNTIVKLIKEIVPEDDVNEDENTAQKELKATSARQLKKMIKRRTQTTRTPLSR